MVYDVIIIGGGPAGMFSAIYAGNRKLKVLLLEKNNKLGKKLLIAGSGKCNLTHTGDNKDFLTKYGDNGKFLKKALYNFKPQDMLDFFAKRGLALEANENGKYFPNTYKSQDVLAVLQDELKKARVEILYNSDVQTIDKEQDFIAKTKTDIYRAKNIVVSTGGLSFPQTGSDGTGYKIAKKLGHKIKHLKPSLTSIFVNDYCFSDLSGLSFYNLLMMIKKDNKKIKEVKGDLLFTHKNLSGPLILDNSRDIGKSDVLSFNFIGLSYEEFNSSLLDKINSSGTKSIKNILLEYGLPERFVKKIFGLYNISDDKKAAELSKKERATLIKSLTGYEFTVSRLASYDVAMATSGGIDLSEINSKTMESKLIDGLYFAGELTDIDGNTGGYNIQAAISMGVLAAESIKK